MSANQDGLPEIIFRLEEHAGATPGDGEGSRWHYRTDFAHELARDYRLAADRDPLVLALYADGETFDSIKAACVDDARAALARWEREDAEQVAA